MKNRIVLFFLLLGIFTANAQAQNQIEVVGKVVDSDNQELIGVTVTQKGTTNATMTDIEGRYKIKVPANATLSFVYVGMDSKDVKVDGKSIINVELSSKYIELNEVVAIGYGTVKRKDLTSAVASVKGKDIENIPVTSAANALSGKVAGLRISQTQGSPDADIEIRIRGGISITQSNEPLYVIDGFPSPDGLKTIDPTDIESIEVLKDASATAIFGAQGANGVILITSKRGKDGKATINFDSYIGFKKISKRMDLLSTLDFVKLEYERAMIGGYEEQKKFVNTYGLQWDDTLPDLLDNMYTTWNDMPGVYTNRKGINWQDEVFDSTTPLTQNYKVSVNGGNKATKYNASYARNIDDGIMKGSGFSRNNMRLRLDQEIKKNLSFSGNVSYIEEKTTGLGSLQEASYFSRMQHIIQYRPIIGREDNDQILIDQNVDPLIDDVSGNVMQNPLTSIREEDREKINKMLQLNGSLTYNITKDLTYRGSIGLYRRTLEDNIFYKEFSRQALRDGAPYGEIKKSNYENLTFSNTLTYAPKLTEGHDLSVMLGQEQTDRKTNTFNVTIKNFPNENFGLDDTSLGANSTIPKTNVFSNKYLSFFGRVSYDLYQKYLFTATLRADGYSAFGKDNKWGYFPSLSTAWRASEEKFIKDLNVFSDLKVRVGYGTSGNKSIPEYLSLFKMSSNWQSENGQSKPSFSSSQISNPALKWETDRTTNIGVDMGFFGHRLQATADFYINEAHDLLLKKNMPLLSGYSDMMQNIGKTRNSGVEFAITSYNIDNKNFKWNTSFNIAFNKNKVVKLTNVDHYLYVSGWASSSEFNGADYLIKEGEPMGQMYGYELEGVYTVADFDFDPNTNTYTPIAGLVYDKSNVPQPGSWKYRDDDGDNEITTKDRKVIGNANPDFYGGITNTFSYKDFDFSFILTYQVGNDVYNANKMYFTKMNNRYRNSLEDAANRFTYIDEKGQNVFNNPTELARINEGKSWASINGSSNLVFHSAYVEDGSYLRLSNITLGYSLPKKLLRKASINNLRVYASANNLFTIAGYSGFDPEVSTKPNSGQTPGIDWGAYPRAFSAIFGINLSF